MSQSIATNTVLDSIGGCLSVACAVHCTMKPLLFILPSLASLDFLLSPEFENYMLVTGISLALISVTWGYGRHRNQAVFWLLGFALFTIFSGKVFVPHQFELALVVPGSFMIAGNHLLNYHYCKTCKEPNRKLV